MPPASIYYCLHLLFSGSDELISPFLFSVFRDSLSALVVIKCSVAVLFRGALCVHRKPYACELMQAPRHSVWQQKWPPAWHSQSANTNCAARSQEGRRVWLPWQLQLFFFKRRPNYDLTECKLWNRRTGAAGLACERPAADVCCFSLDVEASSRRASCRDEAPPSPPPPGLLTQHRDREPSGLSKQAIRRFGGYSAVKVCFCSWRLRGKDIRCGFSHEDVSHLL